MHPLVDEATKKAAVAWLTIPGGATGVAVWCLRIEDSLYVVSGPGEQPAPGLASAEACAVSVRGEHGGRIVSWPVTVARVWPQSEEWAAVATQLAGKRLNASGTNEETVARWAESCVVSRLTPAGDPTEAGPTLSGDSGAAPPRPTPAAQRTAKPLRLHRVRRPRA